MMDRVFHPHALIAAVAAKQDKRAVLEILE